jgi:cytochrome c
MAQSGHYPYAGSTFGFEMPIGIGSKMVFDRNRLGRVALLSGIAYLGLSTFSTSEDADVPSGQLLFNNACRTCHSIREGDNRLGPHMRGIIGRKAGSLPNYSYSSAMRGANFVWNEENLERFIANPDETVPGNNMKPYGGLASAESRAKVIAFLKTLTRAPTR